MPLARPEDPRGNKERDGQAQTAILSASAPHYAKRDSHDDRPTQAGNDKGLRAETAAVVADAE